MRRRKFLKDITLLGLLALLSFLILVPSCLRGNEKTHEPVSPTTVLAPLVPADLDQPVSVEEEIVTEESESARTLNHTPLAILYEENLREYNFGSGRLYQGTRYQTFIRFLREHLPEEDNYRILKAEPATDEDLFLICTEEYINFNKEYFKAANLGLEYPGGFSKFHGWDNRPSKNPGKLGEAARLIVGQAKMACELVQEGRFKKVVSVGGGMHHAFRDHGTGFCIYNDVAFCASYLMQKYGLERILILDTDAHAANGISDYFYEEPRVLLIDLHQDPTTLFPRTGFANEIGSGKGKGFTINIPMPPNADDDCYRLAFESIVEPVVREFKPQIIIWESGSDPHFSDPLTELGLTIEGLKMIGKKVAEMANICDGKAICLICSGYNRKLLPSAWMALISQFGGIEFSEEEEEWKPDPESISAILAYYKTEEVIKTVRSLLKDYWTCLR